MTNFFVCLVTAFSCLSAFAQSGEMKKTTVESEIAALEQSWAAAQKANDPATIASLLADNYIEVLPDGSLMSKSQVLDDAKKSKYETIEVSDLKIISFGDTAIVVGTFDAKHSDKDGKPLQDHERFVDTWRKMSGGKWQCIAEANTIMR
ncbi:MAG TPA: nuclear transport factor 2 family protein [Candidatus Sulfotelmatobacter sp.]|nr:nuclear transport factor 2 family protein [Candidatus Sulfotelmatobacter sp.]